MQSKLYAAIVLGVLLSSGQEAVSQETTVRILFTNNSNGKLVNCNCRHDPLGGLAERVGFVRSYREKYGDILLLDSGGYLGLTGVEQRGPIVMRLMEEMHYTAWGIGDQELYFGYKKFNDHFGTWKEHILNASLKTCDGKPLFTSYKVVTVDGVKIGIIGLVSEETFRFFPVEGRDFTVTYPDSVLSQMLPELKQLSDYIIVLSQMGIDQDREIAKRWADIDLIIGGHSQTLLEKPETVSGCHIVQAGKNGGRVGEILLSFTKEKNVKKFKYNLIEITKKYAIPEDIKPLLGEYLKMTGEEDVSHGK